MLFIKFFMNIGFLKNSTQTNLKFIKTVNYNGKQEANLCRWA